MVGVSLEPATEAVRGEGGRGVVSDAEIFCPMWRDCRRCFCMEPPRAELRRAVACASESGRCCRPPSATVTVCPPIAQGDGVGDGSDGPGRHR